ncbi:Crp/Fnr family transcriptional regulator [Methylobacterium sp. WSM2598]|uniref:Crp/Fnr family transcriptional regulator n=1 Tax=Methylobacterium sp. WSM2598 TaxID=398261 RepID=UPI00036E9D23|nr:Crp/Fnr family transcriptional regulator [Methylobacterium sp. WSM2598]
MASLQQTALRNTLIRQLSPADFAALQPHLHPIETRMREVLIAPNEPVRRLYFPESGFVSVVTAGRSRTEVGLIGSEGLVGASPVLLGAESTPHEHYVQGPGEALAIEAGRLVEAAEGSRAMRLLFLRFVQVLLVQTAQTAFVNATYQIEARLARWLLMCHDRTDGDEFPITHELLALMLGVQRTSVTLALQSLEGHHLIRARRGRITVLGRGALEDLAGGAYGIPEAESARLFAGSGRRGA